jgi:hypothetical protein
VYYTSDNCFYVRAQAEFSESIDKEFSGWLGASLASCCVKS